MKINCHNGLLARMVKCVAGANQKGATPTEVSQYTVLKAFGTKLSAIVARQDFAAIATIDASYMQEEMLTIAAEGSFVVDGRALADDFDTADNADVVTIEHKVLTSKETAKTPDADPENPAPERTGALCISRPAPKGMSELTKLHTVGISINPEVGIAPNAKITLHAAEFSKHLKAVGMSVGKVTMSLDYSNVLIKVKGDIVEMVTTNGQQLTKATFPAIDCDKDVQVLLPYDQVLTIMKMCDDKRKITITVGKGAPQTVVISQEIEYGDKVVGECTFRLREPACKFVNYEPLIEKLSFVSGCKIRTQDLKAICHKIRMEPVKAATVFDPEKEVIGLAKKSPTVDKSVVLPVTSATGPRMELDLSSGHLAASADVCPVDEIELKFSGPKSLECMVLGPNLTTYFQPFRQE